MSEDPLDLRAVAADEAALELLRAGGRGGDDQALSLLRDLLDDVESDLPVLTPVGRGSTVLELAVAQTPERRLARNGTVVAALTAGVLSLGGVAAASTLAPADSPLHGLGEAVRSAAGAVVGAVTPPEVPARATAVLPSAAASPTAVPARTAVAPAPPKQPTPGATVSVAVRSQAAARQVSQLLDQADALLDDGRTSAALVRLDLAERKLGDVLPADRPVLVARLGGLRERATAASPAPRPTRPARQEPPPKTEQKPEQKPERQEPARGNARTGPPEPQGGKGQGKLLGQPSDIDASAKPRA